MSLPLHDLVDVVTVNWNAGAQLSEMVESVKRHDPDVVARLFVVDNGSHDGSADLASDWSKLDIDKAGVNLGFGRACNRAAARGTGRFILLLNPDTALTAPSISAAVAFLQSPEAAAIGICGVRQVDETGQTARNCAYFPSAMTFASIILGLNRLLPGKMRSLLMTDFDHEHSRLVDHVQGAFYLIRRELFEKLRGFDDDYFVYYEDLDLSLRAHELGAKTFYLAETTVFHRGGGTTSQVKGRARFYAMQARLIYARKHYSIPAIAFLWLLTVLVEPITTMTWQLFRYRGRGVGAIVQAFGLFYRHLPSMLRGRTSI